MAPIPDWVNTALFNKQKEEYVKATARLARYELASGVKNEDGTYAIDPLPLAVLDANQQDVIRNPLVVRDEAEREAAQSIVSKTPQAVIDSINT